MKPQTFIFASLVNPRLDIDLLPFWIAYYKACKFDRYVIVLHDDGKNLYERSRAEIMFEYAGWEIQTVGGEFNNGEIQGKALTAIRDSLEGDYYFCVADSDEFWDIPPQIVKEIAIQYDYLSGSLIDRWGEKAISASIADTLKEYYPHEGNIFEAAVARKGIDPLKVGNLEFDTIRSKILCARKGVNVNLIGSHVLENPNCVFTNGCKYKVLHYSWRDSSLERMLTKTYIPTAVMAAVLEMLGESSDTPIGMKLVEKILDDQKAKGWLPAWA